MPIHAALVLFGLMLTPGVAQDTPPSPAVIAVPACDETSGSPGAATTVDVSAPLLAEVRAADQVLLERPPTTNAPPSGVAERSADQNRPAAPGPDAQTDKADQKKPPTPPHTGVHALLKGLGDDVRHLPSKDNLYVALGGGAAALAVHPFDQTFNVRLRSHYTLVNDVYDPGKWVGQTPIQIAGAVVVYVLGRRNDQPKVSHFGMDLLRAQILDGALTEILKLATERERPDHSDSLSFPSGHASMTFATATVIERHLGWKYSVLGYTIAAYVASSRLHDNVHWLSDVVFGAAVGTISGRTVTQHGRNTWTFAPAAVPGGVAVVAVRVH